MKDLAEFMHYARDKVYDKGQGAQFLYNGILGLSNKQCSAHSDYDKYLDCMYERHNYAYEQVLEAEKQGLINRMSYKQRNITDQIIDYYRNNHPWNGLY